MGRPPRIRREQILQTARRVFALKGFDSATLADIAGELGVTPAAVLRYFPTKQALFEAAMRTSVALPQCMFDLRDVDPRTDPRIVLRRFAEQWIPFASNTIAQNIAVQLHQRSNKTFVLPFEPGAKDSPPRQGLRIVTGYFRRAKAAGMIRVANPRAAALMFMSGLVGYVFIHQVAQVSARPYPISGYIDALITLWSRGAFTTDGGPRVR